MKMPNLKQQRQRGLFGMVWAIIILFIVFIIIIGGIAYTMVKTIKKCVPPPPPDEDGNVVIPPLGSRYMGGTVVGYTPPPHYVDNVVIPPPNPRFNATNVEIYASPTPMPGDDPRWTNLVYVGPLDPNADITITNLLLMEKWKWTNTPPPQRFYNIKFVEFNK